MEENRKVGIGKMFGIRRARDSYGSTRVFNSSKKENEARTVLIPFHADRQLDYDRQKLYKGGYLFLQSVYYGLGFDRARKIRERHKFRYDLNAILSDLIYTRILESGFCWRRSKSCE